MDLPFPFPPPSDAAAGEPPGGVDAREQEALDAIADADEPLAVRVVERQGVPVVYVEGEVDIYTAGLLRDRLREVIAAGPPGIVVELGRTQYLDSKGLGVLLQAARAASGQVAVVTSRDRIARLFRATGLDRAMPLYGTLAEALQALAGPGGGA